MNLYIAIILCVLLEASATAQPRAGDVTLLDGGIEKKEISPEAYGRWKTIQTPTLSADGKWVAYSVSSIDGELDLIVRSTETNSEFRVTRRAAALASENPDALKELEAPKFTANSSFLVFTIAASSSNTTVAEKKNTSSIDSELPSLGIMSLPDGQVIKIPRVSSFVLPERDSKLVAYFADRILSNAKVEKILTLRDLTTNQDVQIGKVTSFTFDYAVRYLAYTSESTAPGGAYVRRLADGKTVTLASGFGEYRSITFDHKGQQVAFLCKCAESGQTKPQASLYYAPSPMEPASRVVDGSTLGQRKISVEMPPQFIARENVLTFGIEVPKPASESGKKPAFDFWHWQDTKVRLVPHVPGGSPLDYYQTYGSTKAYLAVYYITTKRFIQLGSETTPVVRLTNDARYAVGLDEAPYKLQSTIGWEDTFDLYLIDTTSGERQLLRRTFKSARFRANYFLLSPAGRFLIYFENRNWFSYEFATCQFRNLTSDLVPSDSFFPEGYSKFPVGFAGWTGDDTVLLYSQKDIWLIEPSGAKPSRKVSSVEGQQQTIFRVWPGTLNSQMTIDASKPMLLTAVDEGDITFSIWSCSIDGSSMPKQLVNLDKRIVLLGKSSNAEQYLVTEETFREFPDLWTGTSLDSLTRISDANPQQCEYRWGNAELITWRDERSVPRKGVLYKPDSFDATKKYPMIVTYYANKSEGLHDYHEVAPSPSGDINPSVFVSKGYVVFEPDIITESPYPGASALKSVVSGVQHIVDRGIVDPKRICVSGHSFGGFETNYIVTHTTMFRCAVESAGVSDAISGYGFGNPNQGYENGQMHIRATPWDNLSAYIENSPVLLANRVMTPLLIQHNALDEAVGFNQGVEFFNALRRNGKEAYLFNYYGEDHNLRKRSNILDWDKRLQEFFDYFLKDAPKPDWMVQRH